MNSITFLFITALGPALAALGCGGALLFAATNMGSPQRIQRACALAWVCFGLAALCLVMTLRVRYASLEAAPRPAQWQLGATVAAGALLLRVSLLRLAELQAARDTGEQASVARLARRIRLQWMAAAVLLGFAAAVGLGWIS
jgi:hypothetical protein